MLTSRSLWLTGLNPFSIYNEREPANSTGRRGQLGKVALLSAIVFTFHENSSAASTSKRPDSPRRLSGLVVWNESYGVGSAYEPPKISELPKVAGQSCWGAGAAGTVVPLVMASCAAARHVSTAGQSAALRVSFHTAAP
jgi:hypothetical protein